MELNFSSVCDPSSTASDFTKRIRAARALSTLTPKEINAYISVGRGEPNPIDLLTLSGIVSRIEK